MWGLQNTRNLVRLYYFADARVHAIWNIIVAMLRGINAERVDELCSASIHLDTESIRRP